MKNEFYVLMLCAIAIACSEKKSVTQQTKQINSLLSPTQANSGEPFLFTDKDGTVYLSWIEKAEEKTTFKFSSLQNNKWSEPVIIASGNTWFVNWADYPMIAANGKQFVAHFLDKSGESTYAYDVKLTTSNDNGRNWLDPIVLHDDKKQAEHGFVTLLPYGDNFFVTWLDGRNTVMEGMENTEHHGSHHGAMTLRAAIIDNKGNKINEWELDNKTCDCCQTSAAITSNGPVVIYRDRSDDEIRDMSIVRLIDHQWTKPKSIHNDNWKIAGCPVNGPRVVAEGNNLAAAWFSAASDTSQVNVIFSTDGGATFGNLIRVDEGGAIGRVDIVLVDNKTAIVSWMEGSVLKAAKVHSDGSKEPSLIIASSSESRSSGFPQMTKSGNQLIFAWTDDKEKNIKVATVLL
ncbi:MAG: exo-alpha-sialidase [Bacteroidetes bacterium]|nr:exo-alpha-sialidase [Bacteroidota bacterium]